MKLTRFRVTKFKSIADSDWINVTERSCLLGVNEAGKTNLLLALWKLNPANDEPIVELDDYPRRHYTRERDRVKDEVFISADFELTTTEAQQLADVQGAAIKAAAAKAAAVKKAGSVADDEEQMEPAPEPELPPASDYAVLRVTREFDGYHRVYFIDAGTKDSGDEIPEKAKTKVIEALPKFVYFSDYGNIQSQIYLPHVIANFERTDLSEKERALTRSLRVLFQFVGLQPQEILDLGKEAPTIKTVNQFGNPVTTEEPQLTAEQIAAEADKKRKREILLQSASGQLTAEFRKWWKQGDYRFRFQADGKHFRIWVSDDRRTEEIELENRSRGLQWFFSFYLVFLVERSAAHAGCVLLLDEPGMALYPLGQRDLAEFFDSLAQNNQLLYTTHSPFLVNPNDLVGVRAVYVDNEGYSAVSSDLRRGTPSTDPSIYPVHAAIGLSVSEGLLLGCQPVLVEGPSDVIYLQMIKTKLLSDGSYQGSRELVFIPTGGVSGIKAISGLVGGRDSQLPYVVVDSDKAGQELKKSITAKQGLYNSDATRIIEVADVLSSTDTEIEDLLPANELALAFSKRYRGKVTDDFDDLVDPTKPIVPQMEDFAAQNGYTPLDKGWKVELARDVQQRAGKWIANVPAAKLAQWNQLFAKFLA